MQIIKSLFIQSFFNSLLYSSLFEKKLSHSIIMYHGVSKNNCKLFNTRHIPVKDFEQQIIFLKSKCHIISLSDFCQKKFILGKINVALTFDDGYENNYLYAKPVLEKYNTPGSFFVTGLNQVNQDLLWADLLDIASQIQKEKITINENNYFWEKGSYYSEKNNISLAEIIKNESPDFEFKIQLEKSLEKVLGFKKDSKYDDLWKLMSDEQIINCQKGGLIEIGSHGFLHNNLGRISHEKACSEILDSKNYLENLTQSKMKSIAYPDGSYSRALIDYCENLGFKNQLAAEGYLFNEDESDPRIHDRKGIYDISDNNNLLYATLKIKK